MSNPVWIIYDLGLITAGIWLPDNEYLYARIVKKVVLVVGVTGVLINGLSLFI